MNQHFRQVAGEGWITPVVKSLVNVLTSPGRLFFPHRSEAQERGPEDIAYHSARARKVDTYVAMWVLIEIASLVSVTRLRTSYPWVCWAITVVIVVRALGIPATAMEIALGSSEFVLSRARMVVLAIINYIELLLCYGVFYTFGSDAIAGDGAHGLMNGLHLSAVSQLTIGYGDLYPTGYLRPVAWSQGVFYLVLLGVAVGRYVSSLGELKDLQHKVEAEDRVLAQTK